eukprot:SAG22_NODE_944_length_6390_cov_3.189795_1_plen_56_part_00
MQAKYSCTVYQYMYGLRMQLLDLQVEFSENRPTKAAPVEPNPRTGWARDVHDADA